jgi:hypothetical protein
MTEEIENEEHKEHEVTIIVNATPVEVKVKEMTYHHVVNIAFDDKPPTGPNIRITVTYSKGEHDSHGSLRPGEEVKVKAGMIFDVQATDKS